ncbi:MAG: RNA polymerase sigma factor [Spirochaetales bacterium]
MKSFLLFSITGDANSAGTFQRVYEAWFPLLFRIVYRMVGKREAAEEIVQEAFIKYYERREQLPTDDGLKYWLIRVVRNLALNYEKRRGRERRALERVFHEPAPRSQPAALETLVSAELTEDVQAALLRLPTKLREVLVLKEYTGFAYAEIGKMLSITEGNVKVRVFRARTQLAKLLKEVL